MRQQPVGRGGVFSMERKVRSAGPEGRECVALLRTGLETSGAGAELAREE